VVASNVVAANALHNATADAVATMACLTIFEEMNCMMTLLPDDWEQLVRRPLLSA
jgi:hypothetical protein